MKHLISEQCLKKSQWHGDTLICPCGNYVATRYMVENEVKIFTYDKFAKYKQQILTEKDAQKIAQKSDLLGNLDNKEWEDLLRDIRRQKENAQCLSTS